MRDTIAEIEEAFQFLIDEYGFCFIGIKRVGNSWTRQYRKDQYGIGIIYELGYGIIASVVHLRPIGTEHGGYRTEEGYSKDIVTVLSEHKHDGDAIGAEIRALNLKLRKRHRRLSDEQRDQIRQRLFDLEVQSVRIYLDEYYPAL